MLMVALHLLLGFVIIVPFIVFGFGHLVTSWKRPNRAAVRYGLMLLAALDRAADLGARAGPDRRLRGPRPDGPGGRLLAPPASRRSWRSPSTSGTGWPGPMINWQYARIWGVGVAGVVVADGPDALPRPAGRRQGRAPRGGEVLLPLRGQDGRRQPDPGQDADDGPVLPGVPQGRLRRLVPLVAPLQLVQQPGVPGERPRDAQGLDGARRQHPGLPAGAPAATTRAVLLRRVRRPELRRREQPDRPGGDHLHLLPRRSPTSTARAATPTTPSRSRSTTRSPTATTRSSSGSTTRWSRPSPSCTSRRS